MDRADLRLARPGSRDRVRVILEQLRGERVLDLGCSGHVPEPARDRWLHGHIVARHRRTVGLDRNAANLSTLSEHGFRRLVAADAAELPFRGRFDTIVAGELIEHLANPGLFLAAARERLAEGGRLVLTTPYPFSLQYALYAVTKFPRTCQNPEHVGWFCPATLTELARRAGFRVAHWELVEDYDPENPAWRYRWFTRVLRRAGRVLPTRLRGNSMLFVLVPDGR